MYQRAEDFAFSDHWLAIAEDYSQQNLTFESDKLPALSGLASYFAERHGQEYYAGIFSGSIPEGLLWAPFAPGCLSRPTKYIAPSWSWLSSNGRIKMIAPSNALDTGDAFGTTLGGSKSDNRRLLSKSALQNARFKLLPEMEQNPYSRLKGGKIEFTGWLKSARMTRHSKEEGDDIWMKLEADSKLMSIFYLDFADSTPEQSSPQEVECLHVLQNVHNVWDNVLILRRVEESRYYERIGITNIDPAWFDSGCFREEFISII